jgi:sulfatase modifying factor 1
MRLGTLLHTDVRSRRALICAAIALALGCSGKTDDGGASTGGAAGVGAGGSTGGSAGTATGGSQASGGTAGTAIGGTGNVGPGCAGNGGVGGMPPYCDDGTIRGFVQGPDGYCPVKTVCSGETPLCTTEGYVPSCQKCPGTGGPEMVSVGDSCVDSTEVTRAQYAAWLATSPSAAGQDAACAWNTSFAPDSSCMGLSAVCQTGCDGHPQVCVDWCDAQAYCASVGKRLCGGYTMAPAWDHDNDAELAEACNAGTSDAYPYGGSGSPSNCNGSELGAGTTFPVMSLASCAREHADGKIYDTAGNVWEWEDACDAPSGASDKCRVRGGSFLEAAANATCTSVDKTRERSAVAVNVGFRCCAN